MIDILLNLDPRKPWFTVFRNPEEFRTLEQQDFTIIGRAENRDRRRRRSTRNVKRSANCTMHQRRALQLKQVLDLCSGKTEKVLSSEGEHFKGIIKYHLKDEHLETIKEFMI